jgi:CheY-like chemotaxis protein
MASAHPHSLKISAPSGSSASTAKPRAQSMILIVDDYPKRGEAFRKALRDDGYNEPLLAQSGDEALDVLGAHAQQFDLVIAWMPLADDGRLDFLQILRQLGSPVRVACATPLPLGQYPKPGRLAGATAILHQPDPAGLAVQADILIQNGATVGHIVASQRVPRLIPDAWAQAIYGTLPGSRFSASLI